MYNMYSVGNIINNYVISLYVDRWFSSVAQSCPTLCDTMKRSTPGLPVHHQLRESTQNHVHWVGDAIHHLILCRPLLLLSSIFPSIRVFSNESALCTRWPKYWSQSIGFGRGLVFDLASLTRHDYFEIHPYYCVYLIVWFFPTSEHYFLV